MKRWSSEYAFFQLKHADMRLYLKRGFAGCWSVLAGCVEKPFHVPAPRLIQSCFSADHDAHSLRTPGGPYPQTAARAANLPLSSYPLVPLSPAPHVRLFCQKLNSALFARARVCV